MLAALRREIYAALAAEFRDSPENRASRFLASRRPDPLPDNLARAASHDEDGSLADFRLSVQFRERRPKIVFDCVDHALNIGMTASYLTRVT